MSKASRQQQRFWLIIAFIVLGYFASGYQPEPSKLPSSAHSAEVAYAQQLSDIQLLIEGNIIKLLPDDNEGSRHQKFIVETPSGQTILVAHNIDLAPRIAKLRVGQPISAYGEYEWNRKGGVLHWTHHDPRGKHEDGWIAYQGQRYQ